MKRSFVQLRQHFDLLVIGGGIYGAWTAYDAALRGLRVALVESRDWACGTSSASSKLIHGGLRYLEHRHFGLVRKSLAERGRLASLAPHRVRPLRFALPMYAGMRVGKLKMRAGMWLYDRFARGAGDTLEASDFSSGPAFATRYDVLDPVGLQCGFTYSDAQTDDARFVVEIVDGAAAAGAVVVNRAEVTSLLQSGGGVAGAKVKDLETGQVLDVQARMVANCAGPWGRDIVRMARSSAPPVGRLSKGVHLVMPPLATSDAFLILSRVDNRVIFLLPWYGKTLLGTTDTDEHRPPHKLTVDPGEIGYLLEEANRVLKGRPWGPKDVISSFAGLRVLPTGKQSDPSSVTRELSIEEPVPNMITPVGGKYTSARVDAAQVVDLVIGRLGRSGTCETGSRPFPWAPRKDYVSWLQLSLTRGQVLGMDEQTSDLCAHRHGANVEKVHDLITGDSSLARRVVAGVPFARAEVVHAAREEMALSLRDVLRRRMPVILLARPTEAELRDAANLIGTVLGWSHTRRLEEVESILGRSVAPAIQHP